MKNDLTLKTIYDVIGEYFHSNKARLEMRAVRLSFQGRFPDYKEYFMVRKMIDSDDIELQKLAEIIVENKEKHG